MSPIGMHKFVVTVIMVLDAVSIKTTRVVVNMKTPLSHRKKVDNTWQLSYLSETTVQSVKMKKK